MFADPAVSDRRVVTLYIRILLRLAWLNAINPDPMLCRPFYKFMADELRPIVTAYRN